MLKIIKLLVLVVVLGACIYVVVMTIREPTERTTEQRELAAFPLPPESYIGLQESFKNFDAWASDRMHFRQQFISWFNMARVSLGWSPLRNVIVGKEGWLFFDDAYSGENQDARGATQFTSDELVHWKNYLIYRNKEVEEHGGKFLFVMLPNKSTMYPEYWPDNYTKLSDNTRMQQIVYLMKDTGVDVIDARDILAEGKKHGQIYLRADTHWNMLGANYVQYEIMKKLAETFPDIQPKLYPFHNASAEERSQLHHPSDLYFMMGLPKDDPGPEVPVVEGIGKCVGQPNPGGWREWPLAVGDCSKEAPSKTVLGRWDFLEGFQRRYLFSATFYPEGKRSLLMIRDSYYEMLQPFFSNHFQNVEYVGLGRPIDMAAWTLMLNLAKPDVVIEEMLERGLKSSTPKPGVDYPAPEN